MNDILFGDIDEIKNTKCVIRNGSMNGNSIPKCSVVDNLEYDDFHLSCDVYNYQGIKTRKLCYLSSIPIKF